MRHVARVPVAETADDDAMFTIGQACRAAGVTRKAIRVYEQRGLLNPCARTTAGYRLFSEDEVATLRFVRRARALGLALDDVADILAQQRAGISPCGSVRTRIAARINEVDDAIAELQALRASLVAADATCTTPAADPTTCPIIETGADFDRRADAAQR